MTCERALFWMLCPEIMFYTIELGLLTFMEGECVMLILEGLLIGD